MNIKLSYRFQVHKRDKNSKDILDINIETRPIETRRNCAIFPGKIRIIMRGEGMRKMRRCSTQAADREIDSRSPQHRLRDASRVHLAAPAVGRYS